MKYFNRLAIESTVILLVLLIFPFSLVAQDDGENAGAVHFFQTAFSTGDIEEVDDFIAPDFVLYDKNDTQGVKLGTVGFILWVDSIRTGFPDWQQTIKSVICQDDWVAVHYTVTGTHTGNLPNLPATGNTLTLDGIYVMRLVDGHIAEMWNMYDQLSLLRQLGVLPAPGINA
jgi:steroid delta-isomerase-like uncharacterized protein